MSSLANPSGANSKKEQSGRNYRIEFSSGLTYRLNSNAGRQFQGNLGSTSGPTRRMLGKQWIASRFQGNDPGQVRITDAEPDTQFSLVAPKKTDLLSLRPLTVPEGLCLCPVQQLSDGVDDQSASAVKGAYYSGAFLLRSTAAVELDVDPDEIVINCLRAVEDDDAFLGEIVFSDYLPNGAGFARWMFDQISYLSKEATAGGEKSFYAGLVARDHLSCDSSCPDCLRHFRNMQFHGLLDWRLGLSFLRLLFTDGYVCGIDGNFAYPELSNWMELAKTQAERICRAFSSPGNSWTPRTFGGLPGFVAGNRPGLLIHPLWHRSKSTGILADAIADAMVVGPNPILADTFNVSRRMSWAYQTWIPQ